MLSTTAWRLQYSVITIDCSGFPLDMTYKLKCQLFDPRHSSISGPAAALERTKLTALRGCQSELSKDFNRQGRRIRSTKGETFSLIVGICAGEPLVQFLQCHVQVYRGQHLHHALFCTNICTIHELQTRSCSSCAALAESGMVGPGNVAPARRSQPPSCGRSVWAFEHHTVLLSLRPMVDRLQESCSLAA